MTEIPNDNLLIADGEYVPAKGYLPGRAVAIEVAGAFDGATVELGYASADSTPIFVSDSTETDSFYAVAKTAPGRWMSFRPASGKPALKVTNSGASTAILVSIVDLYSR